MTATVKEVHAHLIELAQAGSDPITYTELAHHFQMTITGDADVGFWGRLLGTISETEHGRGNPLLSVIVVNEDLNRPGGGFYDLARRLGKFDGQTERDKMTFYAEELRAVYDHWAE